MRKKQKPKFVPRRWKPRFPLGEWIYFDPLRGPALIRADLPEGYLLTVVGSHIAMYGQHGQVHKWTDAVQRKWEGKGKKKK